MHTRGQQVRLGRRKCTNVDVPVRGDGADRRLIRSYEIPALVRATESASAWLNERLQGVLANLDWPIARRLETVRIDLRPLAAYPNLIFAVFASLVLFVVTRVLWRVLVWFATAPAAAASRRTRI